MYSDGDHYLPAVAAINDLKTFLPGVKNVLVLGTGLGSVVQVIRGKGYAPNFTIVEIDKVVLRWAMEFFDAKDINKITPVCMDAKEFMARNVIKYDLIFMDVFSGRVVPQFVYSGAFLTRCKNSLSDGGKLAFNYIINEPEEWEQVKETFSEIFPGYHILNLGVNQILIS